MDDQDAPETPTLVDGPDTPTAPLTLDAVPPEAVAPRRVRLVIESDLAPQFAVMPEATLVAVAVDATRTVRGTINVTRADLSVDGRTIEVYREP